MDLLFSDIRHGWRKAFRCNRHLACVSGESHCRFRGGRWGGVVIPRRIGLCLLDPQLFVGGRRVGSVHQPRAGAAVLGHIVVGGVGAVARGWVSMGRLLEGARLPNWHGGVGARSGDEEDGGDGGVLHDCD